MRSQVLFEPIHPGEPFAALWALEGLQTRMRPFMLLYSIPKSALFTIFAHQTLEQLTEDWTACCKYRRQISCLACAPFGDGRASCGSFWIFSGSIRRCACRSRGWKCGFSGRLMCSLRSGTCRTCRAFRFCVSSDAGWGSFWWQTLCRRCRRNVPLVSCEWPKRADWAAARRWRLSSNEGILRRAILLAFEESLATYLNLSVCLTRCCRMFRFFTLCPQILHGILWSCSWATSSNLLLNVCNCLKIVKWFGHSRPLPAGTIRMKMWRLRAWFDGPSSPCSSRRLYSKTRKLPSRSPQLFNDFLCLFLYLQVLGGKSEICPTVLP